MNIVYFDENYIIEVQKHITNWSSQLPHTCDLQNQGFRRELLQTSGTSRLLGLINIIYFNENYIIEVQEHITN